MRSATAVATLLIALAGHPAGAVILVYDCAFPKSCNQAAACADTTFRLEISFDTITNDASILGESGSTEVIPITGGKAVTFLEFLDDGAVLSTTIAPNLQVVHNRHVVNGGLLSSQYYGHCAVTRR